MATQPEQEQQHLHQMQVVKVREEEDHPGAHREPHGLSHFLTLLLSTKIN